MSDESDIRRRKIADITRLLNRDAEEELLRQIEPLTHRAWVPENFQDFGAPRAAEERKQLRRERLWRHIYRVAIVFVVLGVGFLLGYNVHLTMTRANADIDLTTFNTRALAWLELHPQRSGCWEMKLVNTPYTYRVCRRADPDGKITVRSEGM